MPTLHEQGPVQESISKFVNQLDYPALTPLPIVRNLDMIIPIPPLSMTKRGALMIQPIQLITPQGLSLRLFAWTWIGPWSVVGLPEALEDLSKEKTSGSDFLERDPRVEIKSRFLEEK